MRQRAWQKALLLATGISASGALVYSVAGEDHHRRGTVVVPSYKKANQKSKVSQRPTQGVAALATSTSLRVSNGIRQKYCGSIRTYRTPVDDYFAKYQSLPQPSTMHAVLSANEETTARNNNNNNILVIGDVHGCIDEFQLLYQKAVKENGGQDFQFVILVGDLCNKGPESAKMIKLFRSKQKSQWLAVRGNHDDAALAAALGDAERRQKEKYRWITNNNHNDKNGECYLTDEDVIWMSQLPYTLRIPGRMLNSPVDTVIVHAGLRPNIPLEDQTIKDMITLREVENEHGNHIPWASVWKGPFRVIFGHDARRGLQRYEADWAIGLDTGACYGKKLTGIILPEKKIVSVDALKTHCPITKD